MRSTTSSRCAALPGSSSPRRPFPTRARSCAFAICWRKKLTAAIFAEVRTLLEEKRLLLKSGTIVDATIVSAPTSTKNAAQERDPEMHQTKKHKQWYFGMKVHVGTSKQGLVHSLTTGPAQEADITRLDDLLHGAEDELYGDQAYWSEDHRQHCQQAGIRYRVDRCPKAHQPLTEYQKAINRSRSRRRARGEFAFHVVKRLWGFAKVRYRGLYKNTVRALALFALANLYRRDEDCCHEGRSTPCKRQKSDTDREISTGRPFQSPIATPFRP